MRIKLIFSLSTMLLLAAILLPIIESAQAFFNFSFGKPMTLAAHTLDLTIRNPEPYVNQVFRDNILLSLHYLKQDVDKLPIDWEKIKQPFTVTFTLKPEETFVFHNNVLPEFADPTVSMNSKYFMDEGYLAVGGLGGNGVCHLATLINWVTQDAELKVVAKVNHNFAPVAGVPKEYGTAIYFFNKDQNLYIQNNQIFPVTFTFASSVDAVNLTITKD